MSRVLFTADPHYGHKNIHKFRFTDQQRFANADEHDEWYRSEWEKCVTRRDKVFVLGDAAFSDEKLREFGTLPGRKVLVGGNHDNMTSLAAKLDVFEDIHGMVKYRGVWLTHAPVHPQDVGWPNIVGNVHGHVHSHTINDGRYFNACPDFTIGEIMPIAVTYIRVIRWMGVHLTRDLELRSLEQHALLRHELEKYENQPD